MIGCFKISVVTSCGAFGCVRALFDGFKRLRLDFRNTMEACVGFDETLCRAQMHVVVIVLRRGL